MTKKEQKLFEIVQALDREPYLGIAPIYKYNNFFYSVNNYMAVRTLEEPSCPFSDESESEKPFCKKIEETFETGILRGIPVNLPTKKELVEARSILSAKEKLKKAYIMDAGEMIFALNNQFLNWFLDVFEDGKCFGVSPVHPFYFINKDETIDAILMPIRVSETMKAKYFATNRKEHIL